MQNTFSLNYPFTITVVGLGAAFFWDGRGRGGGNPGGEAEDDLETVRKTNLEAPDQFGGESGDNREKAPPQVGDN